MALKYQINPVTPFQQNSTILWCDVTNEAVVTDPGGDIELIEAALAQQGLTLKAIWLTHGHIDHVGGVTRLVAQQPVPIIGPEPEDDFWIAQLPMQSQRFGFAPSDTFTPDQWLHEGDEVSVGEEAFKVFHIPGHTPGHVVFYHAAQGLLIAGDVLFRESIGRTDFPRGDHAALLHNIRAKLWPLPDETEVIPGHGPMTTIGHEKRYNPFLNA